MSEKRACISSALLAALALVAPAQAHAQSNGVPRLTWTREAGAEACMGENELRRKIADMLGRDPFADPNGPAVSGAVRRDGETLVATLSATFPGETPTSREFRSDAANCAPLTDAVALAIVLSVERAPSPPPVAARPAPIFDTAPAAVTAEAPVAQIHRYDSLVALAQLEWTLGVLPRPTTGVGLDLRYELGARVTAAAGGFFLPPASERGQFSVGLAAARVGACVDSVRASPVFVVNCAYAKAGEMRVENEAGVVPDAGSHAWFAGSLTAAVLGRLGPHWAAEGGLEATVPAKRPTYATQSCPLIGFEEPPATLGVFFSLGAFFL
jgi:hypothetical protein